MYLKVSADQLIGGALTTWILLFNLGKHFSSAWPPKVSVPLLFPQIIVIYLQDRKQLKEGSISIKIIKT